MEEEHSTNNNLNEIVQITSNSRRLQIRRNLLRQTATLRSSPYNSSSSNLRRRQTSVITSQAISNLITNNTDISSNNEEEEEETFISETERLSNTDENEDFDVIVDYSNPSSSYLTNANEQNESYHSLSSIDFDEEEEEEDDDDDDDDDNDHRFYYTSSTEPLINPIDISTQHRYHEYSPQRNHFLHDDEDLSIEIILESSQNNSLSTTPIPTPRRRRSIIPSNVLNNRGLRLVDILSIPQKLYSSLKEQLNDKYQQTTMINTQCYICLEDFQLIDSIKILNCQHVFHTGCINEWLRAHTNCAYCRTPVLVNMLRSSTTGGQRRRQRTRARRHNYMSTRSPTDNSFQQSSIEASTTEREEQQQP